MLVSVDLADYAAVQAHDDRVAPKLNERYGTGVVVRRHELRGGPGLGFRSRNGPSDERHGLSNRRTRTGLIEKTGPKTINRLGK